MSVGKTLALTVVGVVTVICLTVLIALGKTDVEPLGILTAVALQIGNFVVSHNTSATVDTVASRVNGHMTSLINAKTVTEETS